MEEILQADCEWESFSKKTVLVTGAYGMLASYIVFFLIYLREKKGIEVSILAQGRDEQKARERFGLYFEKPYFSFTNEDICSEGTQIARDADYIVHAAGIANPRFYGTNPVEVIKPNVTGTDLLLKNCNPDRLKGFLFFGTCDVYGRVDNSQHITEETAGAVDPLDPHSCYSESKRIAETLLAAYQREYGLRTVSARIGHTYGPTMDIKNDPRVFSSFIRNALNREDIVLHSDGLARRPFCYLSDAAAGYFLLLLKGKAGEAYNVTNTDQFLSIREIAGIAAGLPPRNLNVVMKERRKEDTYQQDTVNMGNRPVEDKLKRLGWKHSVSAEEGFRRVYQFFMEQEGG